MLGTLFSIIIAFVVIFAPLPEQKNTSIGVLVPFLFAIPTLFALFRVLVSAIALHPLQRAEENLTPRALQLLKNDRRIRFVSHAFVFCTLLSYLVAFDISYTGYFSQKILVAVWLILAGISLDLLNHHLNRIYSFANPYNIAKMFTQGAVRSIEEDREIELCESIESLSEICLKSMQRTGVSLSTATIEEMREIVRLFLEASKSLAHPAQDKQTKALGITDKVSYTLFYFFDRIELIYSKALDLRLESICSTIIAAMGKVIVYSAKYDLSLVSYPVHFLGKFSRKAEEQKLKEIGLKGTCTLLEVSKVILNEVDIAYQELKEPFLTVIAQLDEIAKESFRQDKSTNIKILTQPFRDLKEMFESPKAGSHQDTPSILGDLDRVLAEYDALEMVLRTIPPIPSAGEEEPSFPESPLPSGLPAPFPPPPPETLRANLEEKEQEKREG